MSRAARHGDLEARSRIAIDVDAQMTDCARVVHPDAVIQADEEERAHIRPAIDADRSEMSAVTGGEHRLDFRFGHQLVGAAEDRCRAHPTLPDEVSDDPPLA